MAENLDTLKCGGWGVFIAPTTKVAIGEGCYRWPLDSPVVHRTVTVHCPVRLLAPALTSARSPHCSVVSRPLNSTVGTVVVASHGTPDSPVLHRTVR